MFKNNDFKIKNVIVLISLVIFNKLVLKTREEEDKTIYL